MAARKSLRNGRKFQQGGFLGPDRLEAYQADDVWLEKQRRTYDDHLAKTLTSVLREWAARNPGRVIDAKSLTGIMPEALDEFIWRHLDDF
jgi:hypothetical protein